jgi:hypothetical protein
MGMDVAPRLSPKRLPAATLTLLMKPFRAAARVRGPRDMVSAMIVLPFALFNFHITGLTGWGVASVFLSVGMVYTLTARIPMRTRLFRLLPTAAVLLAVALAAAPVPNSAPAGSPPFRTAGCHDTPAAPAPCTQPCASTRTARRPADSALDPCASSSGERGTLKVDAPGGA